MPDAGVRVGGGCGDAVLPDAWAGGGGGGRAAGDAALWRRAERGDFGELLDARLAAAMGEVETGRVRALLGHLVGAVAISLDEVMLDGEGDASARSRSVSRLAQATGRVVGMRRTLAADQTEDAGEILARVLAELDAEQGVGDG